MESSYMEQFSDTTKPRRAWLRRRSGTGRKSDQYQLTPHGKSIIFSAPIVVEPAVNIRRWVLVLISVFSALITFVATVIALALHPEAFEAVISLFQLWFKR